MTAPTVSLIEGDGIGPEITAATVRAIEAAGGELAWERVDAGAGAVVRHGDPLPAATLASIQRTRLALKAPLATPSGGGYRSVNVTLRQHFDLYANVRPARTMAGVPSRFTGVDLVDDKVRRWRVENSWGEEAGKKGFYVMNDNWFDEYVFEIAARRSALPPELQEALDEEPIVLPAWDPMGALA